MQKWYNNETNKTVETGMGLREKWRETLRRIRNPEHDEHEHEFSKQLGFKRLLFILPFIIAALIFWLMSLKG